jgi:hypothetical protein
MPTPENTSGGPTPEEIRGISDEFAGKTETPGSVSAPTIAAPPLAVQQFDIDGKKYSIDQVREAIRGGLRQSDYTRKMNEIKARRDRVERVEALYDELESNAAFLEHVQKFFRGQTQPEPGPGDGEEAPLDITKHPAFQQVAAKLRQVESYFTDQRTNEANQVIDEDMETLKKQFPSLEWDTLQEEIFDLVEQENRRPLDVFWTHYRDSALAAHKETVMRELQSGVEKKGPAAVEPGQGRGAGEVDVRTLTPKQFEEIARKEFQNLSWGGPPTEE